MIRKIILMVIIGLVISSTNLMAGTSEKEQAAVSAAKNWLTLVDEGKYDQSWDESSQYFKNAVDKEKWHHMLDTYRKPMGNLISRNVKSTAYKTSLPGAPDGEYVVIQFKTSFSNKSSAVETVTPMMDKDGKWRVSGYYIK